MNAADMLREALEAAGELRVEPDAYGELRVWDENDDIVLDSYEGAEPALRLIGLLLAAAPLIGPVLDAGLVPDRAVALGALRRAICEAGESL